MDVKRSSTRYFHYVLSKLLKADFLESVDQIYLEKCQHDLFTFGQLTPRQELFLFALITEVQAFSPIHQPSTRRQVIG